MTTYYYIGGATGSMTAAGDWSLSSGGEALAAITWADGDTAVVDSDAIITHNLSLAAAVITGTSGLLVTGTGTPVFVLSGTAYKIGENNTARTLGSADAPFILPNCRCKIALLGISKNVVTAHLKIAQNTVITDFVVSYTNHYLYADSTRTLSVTGNMYRLASDNLSGDTLTFSNIAAVEMNGPGAQQLCLPNGSASDGLTADIPVLLNKTSGSVNIIQSTFNTFANTAHDPLVISGTCPTIFINDYNAAYAAGCLYNSNLPASHGPIQLNGDLSCGSLVLSNGISETYPTKVLIPSGKTLNSDATTWGTNCRIDGVDTDSDSAADSFGTYCTTCSDDTNQDDADDPNYNVAAGIIKTCLVTGPTRLSAPVIGTAAAAISSITVPFTADENASSTTLEYGTDSAFAIKTTVASYDGSAVTGLLSGTTYYYRLYSVGDGTNYSDSEYTEGTPMTTLISLTGLTLSDASPVENSPVAAAVAPAAACCTLQWSRCSTADGAFEEISGATAANYTPVADDVGYYLRCTATGTDTHTGTTAATSENAVVYAAPVLEVEASGASDVTITFSAVAGRNYTLEYTNAVTDDAPDWTNPTTNSSPVSGSAISSLTVGVTYYFRLRAGNNENGYSAWSEVVSATPGSQTLAAPANIAATADSQTQITITFTADEHASSTTLHYIASEYAPDWDNVTPTELANFASGTSITGLTPSIKYYFRLRSIGDGVDYTSSDWTTEELTATTPDLISLEPPTNLSAKAFSKNKIIVTFTPSPAASSHTVEYDTAADFSNAVTTENFTSGAAVFASAAETRVYIRLWAVGDNSTYADSPKVTANTLSAPANRFIVLNNNDSGEGSLRQALADASDNDVDTVTFDASLSDATITLASGLTSAKSLVIDAASLTNKITLSGNNLSTCLSWSGTGTLNISNLILKNSISAGIRASSSSGHLTMTSCELLDNNADADNDTYGGGIFTAGTLTLSYCQIKGNRAARGGGIYATGATACSNCVISENYGPARLYVSNAVIASMGQMQLNGCGIYSAASLVLTDCHIEHNIFSPRVTTLGEIDTLINVSITGMGGGVYAESGLTAVRCTFIGNQLVDNENNASNFIRFSSANTAGAVYSAGPLTLSNCLIADNVCENYAAIFLVYGADESDTVFINCTIAGNTGQNAAVNFSGSNE